MDYLIFTGLFLPLLSFLCLMGFSAKLGRSLTGILASSVVLISFMAFLSLLIIYQKTDSMPFSAFLYSWIDTPTIHANITFLIDPLSLMMALIITGVGFLIHVYSIGYMEDDADYVRYFACMNFFIFSMLLLVLGENLLLLFIGWEGVGLASYLLIGFYYYRPAAAQAATKAFVVNRIGDLGFLLGIVLTFYLFGTADINEISKMAGEKFAVGAPMITLLTLLYFIGAVGKSAQLPLYTWLPDAMEGPTPVSALIHAATMVTAGVYLVVRMHALFMLAPLTLLVVGVIGGITALFAALCACGQTDLKRVLAYSTISQLGFMFLACGTGAFYAAMFHLMTHAFMKSLLFLSAGIVVHGMGGVTDMTKMGGLSKIFTKTHWLFLIGALAMSGVPPLAAFFSKDMILEQEFLADYTTLFYVGLVASILTAFYLIRAYCLTFTGPLNTQEAHEGPNVMLIPVAILAFLSIVGGFIGFGFGKMAPLQEFLSPIGITLAFEEPKVHFLLPQETWMAVGGTALGIGLALIMYLGYRQRLGPTLNWLRRAFFIDDLYDSIFVHPLKTLSRWIADRMEPSMEKVYFQVIPQGVNRISSVLQLVQSGQIRSYAAWMVVGAVVLFVYLVFV